MRNGMPEKGSECFKEILSRNDKHLPRYDINFLIYILSTHDYDAQFNCIRSHLLL
jgi:hypothetical protein